MRVSPEFKESWPSVIVAFIGMALSVPTMPLFGWGLFMHPVSEAFGWPLAQTSSGLAAFTISMALAALPVGYTVDRFGPYRVLALSMPVSCAALAALALTEGSLLRYYLLWIIVGIAGVGSGPIVWTRLLAARFNTSRGLALGIASCGAAAFLLVVKPLIQTIILSAGWQIGLAAMGLLPLVLLYPASLLVLRPRIAKSGRTEAKAAPETGYTLAEVIRNPRFAIMLVGAICGAAVPGMLPHLEGALTSRGISVAEATTMTSLMGGSLLMGRLMAGYCSDRFWAPGLFAFFLLLSGSSAIGLISLSGWTLLFLCILGIGAASGGEFELFAYVTSRYFGLRAYSATFGLLYGLTAGLGGLWSVVIGRLADTTGNYIWPLQLVFASLALAALLQLFMGRPPRWEEVKAS